HTAAVLVSNYTVTLANLATDLWSTFGYDKEQALEALLPLLEGTVANLRKTGLPGAITGPIARGDVATMRHNLDALSRQRAEIAELYRLLALETIPIAIATGGLGADRGGELRRTIDASRRGTNECSERNGEP